jgi:hypothetical protein
MGILTSMNFFDDLSKEAVPSSRRMVKITRKQCKGYFDLLIE